jgi:hypothetical protein
MNKPQAFFSCLLFFSCCSAEAQSFHKKELDFNLGVGAENTFLNDPGTTIRIPMSINICYGISDVISTGLYYCHSEAAISYNRIMAYPFPYAFGPYLHYQEIHRWSFNIAGVRVAYYFSKLIPSKHFDFYAGLMPGYLFSQETIFNQEANSNPIPDANASRQGFICAGFLGCRYNLNERAGLYAEGGYGITYMNIGINIHLGSLSSSSN